MWKENRFGWPLRGIIWFYLVIVGSCAVIALLAGYVQKAKSLEKVTQRVESVTRIVGITIQIVTHGCSLADRYCIRARALCDHYFDPL
jgi:small-conductance mechanosensitive channel